MFQHLLRKLSIITLLLVLFSNVVYSQQALQPGINANSFTAVALGAGVNGTAFAVPQGFSPTVSWQTTYTGGPSAVNVVLQGSLDNIAWFTIDTTTNTAGELRYINPIALKFIRGRIVSHTGGTNITLTLLVNRGFNNVISGGTLTTPLLAPNTPVDCSAPGYSFIGDTNTGIGYLANDTIAICAGGVISNFYNSSGLATNLLTFDVANSDVRLQRETADHLFQRRGAVNQRWSMAVDYTSSTNYSAFSIDSQTQANQVIVGTRTATTGTIRPVMFVSQRNNATDQYAALRLDSASTDPIRVGFYDKAGAVQTQSAFTNLITLGEATNTGSSGVYNIVKIIPTYNQTGTAGGIDFLINRTETALGSGTHRFADFQVAGISRFIVANTGTIFNGVSTPAASTYLFTTVTTGDDPNESLYQNRVTTTDATVTTVATVTIPASQTVAVNCTIVARRTGGASGTAEDGAYYELKVAMKGNAGNNASEIAAETVTVIGESQAGFTVSSVPSAGTELIQVTGAASNNITWHSHCRLNAVGS